MAQDNQNTELNVQAPEEKKTVNPVFGIDFGSSKSVVAIGYDDLSLPHIVHNNLSNDQTPNLIGFKGKQRMIGEEALNLFVSNPQSTITNIRRLLGLQAQDEKFIKEKKKISCKIENDATTPVVSVSYRNENVSFTPQQLAAMIFSKLAEYASNERLKTPQHEVDNSPRYVISVPGSYDENQRTAVIDAAKIAQLNVIGLINDITAASLCYGFLRNPPAPSEGSTTGSEKKTVLFLELGHSYFSSQVVNFTNNKMDIVSSLYDDDIGARSFDYALFDYVSQEFKKKPGLDIESNIKAMNRVLKAAEKCKQVLSTIPETDFTVESLLNDKDLNLKVSRSIMEDLCKNVLDKIGSNIKKVLELANMSPESLHSVEVIGGGVRIPSVQSKIKSSIGDKDIGFSLDSAHCIAMGAAIMAKIMNPEFGYKYEVNDPNSTITNLPVSTLNEEDLSRLIKINQDLINNDKLINMIHTKRNELESYIYSKRKEIDNPSRSNLINELEKMSIRNVLENAENFLYDVTDDTELDEISNMLENTQKSVNESCPKLYEQLKIEEEQRKKEAEEAAEFTKNYKPEKKEREIPRTKAEKIEIAKKKKHQGNVCFKDGDYDNAVKRYTQAISYFDDIFDLSSDQKSEVDDIKLSCYLNNSACYIKLNNWEKSRDNCSEALKIDSNNIKALYRRAQSYYNMRMLEESKNDLSIAIKIDNNNSDVKKLLKIVNDQLSAQLQKEKKVYSKMFG